MARKRWHNMSLIELVSEWWAYNSIPGERNYETRPEQMKRAGETLIEWARQDRDCRVAREIGAEESK